MMKLEKRIEKLKVQGFSNQSYKMRKETGILTNKFQLESYND